MTINVEERHRKICEFLACYDIRVGSAALVAQALVHRSYAYENQGEPDNERLEFLGDAILAGISADYLYHRYPEDLEGVLSKKKAFLVSRHELGIRAEALGLGELVLLGRGEEHSGGRQRLTLVGSALEALIGALYFLIPYSDLRDFVCRYVLEPGVDALNGGEHLDYKSRLQELVQKTRHDVPDYVIIGESGPAHRKNFVVEVRIGDRCLGRGEGERIKVAENRAAEEAFERLTNNDE
jgi:ribonuclease-3